MELFKKTIVIQTLADKTTYVDLTPQVRQAIQDSAIYDGIVVVSTAHTTCSIFFEEFSHDINQDGDEFLQEDLNRVLGKIIPDHIDGSVYKYPGPAHYQAVESWPNADEYLPDGDRRALWNGDAHIKSTLLGNSQIFDVDKNQLGVGSTGYIYFADFDKTRDRTRQCKIIVLGNKS